jgi:uncharacterized protein YaiL (DUF2058 family)
MTSSLRDQLMQLGFKAPEPAKPRERGPGKPGAAPPGRDVRRGKERSAQPAKPRNAGGQTQEEIDLARAYALRQRVEREEQQRLERERQAEAARRREARQKLFELMQKASLNAAEAELPRHFEHGGKIRRLYVTAEQLKSLNAGGLAIVSAGGRYHLVNLEHATEAEGLMPGCVALRVDPDAPDGGDDYSDPRFAVPDDLVW